MNQDEKKRTWCWQKVKGNPIEEKHKWHIWAEPEGVQKALLKKDMTGKPYDGLKAATHDLTPPTEKYTHNCHAFSCNCSHHLYSSFLHLVIWRRDQNLPLGGAGPLTALLVWFIADLLADSSYMIKFRLTPSFSWSGECVLNTNFIISSSLVFVLFWGQDLWPCP